MWTATLKGKQIDKDGIYLVVEFSDGSTTFGETIKVGSASDIQTIKNVVRAKVNALEGNKSVYDSLTVGAAIDATASAPTQAEQEKTTFFTQLNKLRNLNELVSLGVIPQNSPDVVGVTSTLSANYKSSFFN